MIKTTQPTIFTRNSKLWVNLRIDGKRIRKPLNLDDTKHNRKIVDTEIIPQLILDVNRGEFFNNITTPTLQKFAMLTFDAHSNDRRASTTKEYKSLFNCHINPHFGHLKVDEIKVSEVNRWKNLLVDNGLSTKRVNDIKNLLGNILRDAVDDNLISSNPVAKSKSLRVIPVRDIQPFSLDEIKTILGSLSGQNRNIIAMLFLTGLRTGELIGLKWSDIDFERKTIDIKRTVRKGVVGSTKTSSSERTIPIIESLLGYLQQQYKLTGTKNSYVFLTKTGNHLFDSKNIRDGLWRKVLTETGLEYRPVYNTRHTYCSLNIQNGEDILWVSSVMGHKNIGITMERYAKYIPTKENKSLFFNAISA